MNIIEYQKLSKRTCTSLGIEELDLLHMNIGVNTEIAEALDAIKKHIAYGKPLDLINIQEEIADVCFYLVNKATFEKEVLKDLSIITSDRVLSLKELAIELMQFLWQYNTAYHSTQKFLENLYYYSICFNLNFFKGLENNVNKLLIRFPINENFTKEKALNRNLEQERIELEK